MFETAFDNNYLEFYNNTTSSSPYGLDTQNPSLNPGSNQINQLLPLESNNNLTPETNSNLSLIPEANTLPEVTIQTTDKIAKETNPGEAKNRGQFTLSRTGNVNKSLTVKYGVTGSATNTKDYQELTGTITFKAGASKARINVIPKNDQLIESSETVFVTLKDAAQYNLGTNKRAQVNIVDNDFASGTRQFVKQTGSQLEDRSNAVATDSRGNFYLAGYTSDTVKGFSDGLITKYNSNGQQIWSKKFGKPSQALGNDIFVSYTERIYDVDVDSQNNVYLAGVLETRVSDFNGTVDTSDDTVVTGIDVFLLKYNSNGKKIWEVTHEKPTSDTAYALDIDKNDRLYITGVSSDINTNNIITARFNSNNGKLVWWREVNQSDFDEGKGITTDDNGNVYVTGKVADNNFQDHVWTAKYNANGKKIWSQQLDFGAFEEGTDIVVDKNKNVYISGTQTSGNLSKGFLVKYDGNGQGQWSNTYTNQYDAYESLTINGNNIYIGGTLNKLDNNQFVQQGLVTKINLAGKLLWQKTLGAKNNANVVGNDLAIDRYDNLYVTGETNGRITGKYQGDLDIWFAKYTG